MNNYLTIFEYSRKKINVSLILMKKMGMLVFLTKHDMLLKLWLLRNNIPTIPLKTDDTWT